VVKLELGENKLGVKTLLALQASMRNNGTLKYVSLESNPLFDVRSKDAEIIIQALASIIETSTSLKTLILWRCGIGPIGGEVIAQSIMKNQSLTCLELGYNDWKHEHIEIITCKLEANKASCMLEMEAMKLKMEEQEKERLREEYAKRVQGEKNHVEGWLTQQGIFRCQQRLDKIRVEERKMEEIARKEAERIRQEKLTYEALAVKNSKKKKNYTKKIPPKRI
jgi:Ran GTPase-activating protein (RanGAP) involved in mRNA processing and transport